mmetsp:Transcript_79313/g.164671  ORF Transcript_79313/g.164671 Transcript_79313/m.164671 type:complete len:226 (-) Transcript_79313:119-796(-)
MSKHVIKDKTAACVVNLFLNFFTKATWWYHSKNCCSSASSHRQPGLKFFRNKVVICSPPCSMRVPSQFFKQVMNMQKLKQHCSQQLRFLRGCCLAYSSFNCCHNGLLGPESSSNVVFRLLARRASPGLRGCDDSPFPLLLRPESELPRCTSESWISTSPTPPRPRDVDEEADMREELPRSCLCSAIIDDDTSLATCTSPPTVEEPKAPAPEEEDLESSSMASCAS